MSHTEQMREALTNGAWYWVRYESLNGPVEAPAMYRADAEAFYSHEFSGIPTRRVTVVGPALTAPAAEVPEPSPDDLIRVAVFGLGASELCTKYEHVQHEVESHLDDGTPESEDSPTYTLTFKTITRAEFDALGEFDGF